MLKTSFYDYYQSQNLYDILCEGGLAGHMTHIYEDLNLTFGEFKNIFKDLIDSKIEAYEKVDGQNIYFTWDLSTNQAKFARNKSEAEKGGITLPELKEKFKERGTVERAFSEGGTVIQNALSQVNPQVLNEIFDVRNYKLASGNVWINAEIMHSANPNVIQYSGNNIVLHDMDIITPDEIGQDAEMYAKRIKNDKFPFLIKQIETAETNYANNVWKIAGPQIRKLTSYGGTDVQNAYSAFVNTVSELQRQFSIQSIKLNDNSTLGDFIAAAAIKKFKESNYPDEASQILGQLAGGKISKIKKKEVVKRLKDLGADTKLAADASLFKLRGELLVPIQRAVTDISIEVLKGISSYFVDIDKQSVEAQRIQSELQRVIQTVEATKDEHYEKRKQFLARELERLKNVLNFASAIEGLVIEYPPGSGNKLKITGAFAPANQILGMAKYGRGPVPPLPQV